MHMGKILEVTTIKEWNKICEYDVSPEKGN